jgi:hypothetical protein
MPARNAARTRVHARADPRIAIGPIVLLTALSQPSYLMETLAQEVELLRRSLLPASSAWKVLHGRARMGSPTDAGSSCMWH